MGQGLTLFVFEGPRAENIVSDGLYRNFMGVPVPAKCVYGTSMYSLYQELKGDSDLDLLTLLKERNNENRAVLEGLSTHDVEAVYLFFDYDGHASNASDAIVDDMLYFFDDEYDVGKLFVSYPMVEALRHYPDRDTFMNLIIKAKKGGCNNYRHCDEFQKCKAEKHYKKVVSAECRQDLVNWGLYGASEWGLLIRDHVMKSNLLVNGVDEWPMDYVNQKDIFDVQMRDYLSQSCPKVSVLSGFPMFVLNYYGSKKLASKLDTQDISSLPRNPLF